MSKQLLCVSMIAVLLLVSIRLSAQVGINTDGSQPDNSAILDVKSNDKGVLIPRMGTSERDQIPSPATGLLIYNTTTNLFNYYDGSTWNQVEASYVSSIAGIQSSGGGVAINAVPNTLPHASAMLDVNNQTRGVLVPRTLPGLIPAPVSGLIIYNTATNQLIYYNSNQWVVLCGITTGASGATGSQASIGVAINADNSSPHHSSMLDVSADNLGVLIPRLSEAERDAVLPVNGLVIFNSSSNNLEFFNGSAWYKLNTNLVSIPLAGICTPSVTQIIWNWNTVSGATGYKWGTTNNYANATDMGTAISKTETGLTCNTAYARYAWAYNSCGNSTPVTLTQTTSLNPPGAPSAGIHVPSPTQIVWKWNTVSGATGYKWGTTNNYANATDMGTAITKTETGLTCNTAYTRYAWAYSGCGNSTPITLTQTTSLNPPAAPTAGTHVPSQTQIVWKWNTVSGATGYKWGTTNNYANATDMGTAITKTETGLTCNTAYTRYAWAYSGCGNSTPVTLTQTSAACPFTCGTILTDTRDGKTYSTVLIGTQCWFAKNLNVGTRINSSAEQSNNSTIEKYCISELESNCNVYGGLYQWAEMVQYLNGATNTTSWNPVPTGNVRGICPTGWHLPTDAEWTTLTTFLGYQVVAGGKLKETGLTHWYSPNTGATNSTGFTALPGGASVPGGGFDYVTTNGLWWSSTEFDADNAWIRMLYFDAAYITRNGASKFFGHSVRCLKD